MVEGPRSEARIERIAGAAATLAGLGAPETLTDVLARHKDGRLMLYRGNGKGGWAARGYAVGSGWGGFTAIVGVG